MISLPPPPPPPLEPENPDLGIRHFLYLIHRAFVIHTLNRLVDDTMTYCKYRLVRIRHLQPSEEVLCPRLHPLQSLDIIRPILRIFGKRRNELTRKISPVTFSD